MLRRSWKKYQTGFAQLNHRATGFGQLQQTSPKQVNVSDSFDRVEVDQAAQISSVKNAGSKFKAFKKFYEAIMHAFIVSFARTQGNYRGQ